MLHILISIALLQNSLKKSSQITYSSNSTIVHESRKGQLTEDFKIPSPTEVYQILIGMQDEYPEGKYWTDASSGTYTWKGGTGNNREIANMGTGCVYFCFHLSDTAFNTLPARLLRPGSFKISDIRSGDILRTDHNRHSVIVLQVYDESVVIAEGNFNKAIHWGRILTKSEVESADHLITRYPEGYVAPEDPSANVEVAGGSFGSNNQLHWSLNGAGYLTISGTGECPDYDTVDNLPPWQNVIDKVTSVIVEEGVASIGSNAFRDSNVYGLTIAGTVKIIGDNAFRSCSKLTMVSIPEGTEVLGSQSFRGCVSLKGVTLPSTIKEVQAGALSYNTALTTVKFTPGDIMVKIGDSLLFECYCLMDLTLPTLMDCVSKQMFYNSRMPYLFIPHGVTSIGDEAFRQSTISTLVIPNTVTEIGMFALGPKSYLQDIYFCGTQAQWNSIDKSNNGPYIADKTIHYVADIASVKILNVQGENVEGTTVQMGISDSFTYAIEMTFSNQGETPLDSRSVEWFCVVPDTQTNDIKAIESAVDAGDIVEINIITANTDNAYSVSLKVKALKNGKARIIGHVKKNPTSSMANNADHVYSYFDINIPENADQGPNQPPSNPANVPQDSSEMSLIVPDVSTKNDDTENDNTQNDDTENDNTQNDDTESDNSENDDTENDFQKPKDKGKKGLSGGAIAGIVIAAVAVVAAGAGVGIFLYLRHKKSKVAQARSSDSI